MLKKWWMDKILAGEKVMEIRGKRIVEHLGKRICLAASGSSAMSGSVELVGCHGPLTAREWHDLQPQHCVETAERPYGNHTYAYVLQRPQTYPQPIPFQRKRGSVIWQNM